MTAARRIIPITPPEAGPPPDRSEFFALYTRHARQIYAFIRTLVSNQADAEDAFQDASAVLWQKFEQFQTGTNFLAWATQVSRYCVLTQRDNQRRAPALLSDEFIEIVADEAADMFDQLEAQHRALADCYQRLGAAERELIDRRYRLGASAKELADHVGRPLRTIYRWLERIHSSLLDCIQRNLNKEGAS